MPDTHRVMPPYRPMDGGPAKRLRAKDTAKLPTADIFDPKFPQLLRTISLVLVAGGAVLLGTTSDGGALLIRAWIGGEKYEDYCTTKPEVVLACEALSDAAEASMTRRP
jgi:hypothetical protein